MALLKDLVHRRTMGKTLSKKPKQSKEPSKESRLRGGNVGLCVFALFASASLVGAAYYYPGACIVILERLYGYIGLTGVVIVPLSAYIVCGLALLCHRVCAAPVSDRQDIYESLTKHLVTVGQCNYLAGLCGTLYGVLQYLLQDDAASVAGLVNAMVSSLLPVAILFLSVFCCECVRLACSHDRLCSEPPCDS